MKTITATILMALCVSFTTIAQEKKERSPETAAVRMTAQLDKKLDLTEEQEGKIKEILKTAMEDRKALREKAGTDESARKEARTEIRTAMENRDNAIKEVLNETQYETYLKVKDQIIERRKARKQAKGSNGGNG